MNITKYYEKLIILSPPEIFFRGRGSSFYLKSKILLSKVTTLTNFSGEVQNFFLTVKN